MSYPPPPADDRPDNSANYTVPGYPQPHQTPYGYGYPPPQPPVNGMAIASLVVSCAAVAGLCGYGVGGLLGIVGAILGHVGRRQARRRGERGGGMALAGIIVGWVCAVVAVLAISALIYFIVTSEQETSGSF